jgi:hypothetical protein
LTIAPNKKIHMIHIGFANILFLSFIAIIPFANTTALKNLLLVSVILSVVFNLTKKNFIFWFFEYKEISLPLFCIAGFLGVFPFISIDKSIAIAAITGQWAQSILTWFCAAAIVLQQREKINFKQVCFWHAIIVIFFFLQLAFAVSGLFGENPPRQISIDEWRVALLNAWAHGLPSYGASLPFPFVGYDEMHGNLGYAGSQVIALASAWYLFESTAQNPRSRILPLIFIITSLLSAIWISSRGAFVFDILILLVAFLSRKKFEYSLINPKKEQNIKRKSQLTTSLAMVSVLILFVSLVSQTILKDERWLLMKSKIEAGWMVKDPVSFMCNGFRPGEQEEILEGLQIQNPEISQKIMAGFDQDAGRAVLLQVGWQLVKENPWGIDGSRQSYEKAIAAKCGGQPTHNFAHAHNGWINLALAFGWLGAGLYFALLMQMAIVGWRHASSGLALPWSSALFLVAFFWIIRGLTDACYQDHYIQMQGVLLGYLYARTKQEASSDAEISTA